MHAVRSRWRSDWCVDPVRFCDWARGLDDVSLSDAQEAANSTVNVRTRDNAVHGTKSVDALIAEFKRLETEKSPDPPPPEPAAPK